MDAVAEQRHSNRLSDVDAVAARDMYRDRERQRFVDTIDRYRHQRVVTEKNHVVHGASNRVLVLSARRTIATMQHDVGLGNQPVHGVADSEIGRMRAFETQARPLDPGTIMIRFVPGHDSGEDITVVDEPRHLRACGAPQHFRIGPV